MAAVEKFKKEFKGHTVHVGHGEYAYHIVAALYCLAQHSLGKVVVAPQGTEGHHHAFGEAGGAARIVYHCQLLTVGLTVVGHVFLAEKLRIFAAEQLVEVLAGIGQLVGTRHHERIVGYVDDAFQRRHARRVDDCAHHIAHKQET